MKKWIGIVVSLVLVIAGIAYAKDYEVKKKAGNYDVEIKIDKNPPSVGKNNMEIEIREGDQKITDAKVKVEYSMPAMPGMPPMDYKTKAELKDEKYHATIDLSMAGPWNIEVRITRDGKTSKAKFSIDAQ